MLPVALGVRYNWICQEQVLMYEVSFVSPEIISAWSHHVIEALGLWPTHKPLQLLYNVSRPRVSLPYFVATKHDIFNLGLPPTGRDQVHKILLERGNLFGRLAVLTSSSASSVFLKAHSTSTTFAIESQLFVDYKRAIDWLTDTDGIAQDFSPTQPSMQPLVRQRLKRYEDETLPHLIGTKLHLTDGQQEMLFVIPDTNSLVIGRQNFDEMLIGANVAAISRIHAQFDIVNGTLYVMDLMSTNGTFVNGQRLQPSVRVKLEVGNELRFAYTNFQVDYYG